MTTRSSLYTRPGGPLPHRESPPPLPLPAGSLPSEADIVGRAGGENFRVASRLLPRASRRHLMRLYGFARLVDELGDAYPGDRLAALDVVAEQLRHELATAPGAAAASAPAASAPTDLHGLIAGAARSTWELGIDPAPLFDLIDANRQDQAVTRYATFADLIGYCRRSANPVGRLVLGVFGAATPERVAWSDAVCTGLQLAEHCQDVAEDAASGRVYLPAEDLERFGVGEHELAAGLPAGRQLRALIAFEVARARRLLGKGTPLVRSLGGRPRWAVAGFVAGGLAALDAIAARGFDPLGGAPRPARLRVAVRLAQILGSPAPQGPNLTLEEAYRHCEAVTTAEARNFSYGIKLLPPPKRRAMSALYAMARRIDDIGDGTAPPADKLAALAQVRKQLAQVATQGENTRGENTRGENARAPASRAPASRAPASRASATSPTGEDPVLMALADVARRYPIPLGALDELVEGCEMDVEMDVNGAAYASFDDLVGYCRRVAGTVGRLSLGVYGCADPARAEPLADTLGVALQVTNILRDIVEDRDVMGRVYLPAEDRDRFGAAPDLSGPLDAVTALIVFEAARAEELYERGLALLPLLDWRSRACTAAMAGIYRQVVVRIQRDPAAVLRGRVSLPAAQKAAVATRALTRGKA